MSYIYLIKVRTFNENGHSIYKIGKTTQHPYKRIKQYNKDSEIISIHKVNNCHEFEKEILKQYNEYFTQVFDIGKEYFIGDEKFMVKLINKHYNKTEKELTSEEIVKLKEENKQRLLQETIMYKFLHSGKFKFGKDKYIKRISFIKELNEFSENNNYIREAWSDKTIKILEQFNIIIEKGVKIEKSTGNDYKGVWLIGVDLI